MKSIVMSRPFMAGLIAGLSILTIVALMMTVSSARASDWSTAKTSHAEVLGINHDEQTMTVRLIGADAGQEAEITLSFSNDTGVIFCTETKAISDFAVGDMVTLTYHETLSGYVADSIDIPHMAASPGSLMC